jgi:ribose transport system ATP-binding protein
MLTGARVFVLCEPTRGVDVRARRELYGLIEGLRDDGCAVLIVSSDGEDLLSLCDRIAIVVDGRLTRFSRTTELSDAELEKIL